MAENKKETEEFVVTGDNLVAKVKELIKAGNVAEIIIKNDKNETLIKFPVTVGVVGVLVAPILAAVGAVAALVAECKIVVVKNQ
ncbi:DUF4342 domain-containing protein [Candidatus Saccharibacteria bacterium]|nr:DUF4342 domain-containing protein [Candidatus Saccharibacteria bacterium]